MEGVGVGAGVIKYPSLFKVNLLSVCDVIIKLGIINVFLFNPFISGRFFYLNSLDRSFPSEGTSDFVFFMQTV